MAAVRYHDGKFPPKPKDLDLQRLVPLIGPANAAVARYEGLLHGIPNAQVLLSPLTRQEAVLSSRIEGTQATLGDVLGFEASEAIAEPAKRDDIREVLNYRSALRSAVEQLDKLPLSERVIRSAHKVLMRGVRGERKTPGQYRRIQNWLGPEGCTIEQARFVPPSPNLVSALMSDWAKYLHGDEVDRLVQLAIAHAEFESIHPFLDGNGRIGRLLVPLFMVDKGLLSDPCFYISDYLEAHRGEYYDRLLAVSEHEDWTGWCEFFLVALTKQAEGNEAITRRILDLYHGKKAWMVEEMRSRYAVPALDWFFDRPVFLLSDFVQHAGIPQGPAYKIAREARDSGLLRAVRYEGRGKAYAFSELIKIADGRASVSDSTTRR